MDDVRAFFERLVRRLMGHDELVSLHREITTLVRRLHRQDRVIRRLRAHDTLEKSQVRYVRRTFRIFMLLKAAPFYRDGHWIGLRQADSLGLTERLAPIVALFRLCDWRQCTLMLHDVEHHTSATFARVVRSFVLGKRLQSLERKVFRLRERGVFKREVEVTIPYLGSDYRIRWRDSDVAFDDDRRLDAVAIARPIRSVHSHVAFLYTACAEFCLLCGVTDDVTHHALTECALNAISIAPTDAHGG
jgi:hypothetical protein